MQRRLLPLLLLLLGAALPAAAAEQAPSPFFPYPMKVDRLPNGLTVVRVPFNSPGLIAYQTVVRVGSRNEVEPGKTGFAHFFEHMMFKGTKNFPEGEREKVISTYGYDDNAFTSDDVTVYHSYGPTAGLEKLVEIEADRFRNLEYSEPSFQTEALAVLGEYHKNAAQPYLKIEEELARTAFTKHTYGHTTLGYYDDIKAMPQAYAYSRTFFERWYTPDNVILVIVGDFNDDALMQAVRKSYGPWDRKSATVTVPTEPPQTKERSVHIDWPQSTQPRLIYAWHTPAARLDTSSAAIQTVLADYLAGPTSPLYKELVLDKQLAQEIGGDATIHRDPHLFSLVAVLQEERYEGAVRSAFNAAVKELATGKVDAARVEAIKSNTRYGLLMGMETAKSVATQLSWYAGIYGTPDALARHYQKVSEVKPADLVTFARKYLTAANRTVLTLTPKTAGGQK
ncbi:pitrilysin family protein [Vitiosangium sp. GDMCC 1.1324]|uniref:M16 family metallopeptidase n=1 Tax=Vitiosangium sp. (strain GDMCC 1.1324) TaxID=2138576 RepID=UPI000D3665AD|nr:pitrilysin family protein [Vitiosangium sp. GDMCC 1.1324]PTL77920.1 peptidase M16 [Vitiosangium sp. GDMCC 1.1324]